MWNQFELTVGCMEIFHGSSDVFKNGGEMRQFVLIIAMKGLPHHPQLTTSLKH